jgi:hypothetical protein
MLSKNTSLGVQYRDDDRYSLDALWDGYHHKMIQPLGRHITSHIAHHDTYISNRRYQKFHHS